MPGTDTQSDNRIEAARSAFGRWVRRSAAAFSAALLVASPLSAQDVESFDPDDAFGQTQESATETAQQAVDKNLPNTSAIDADLVDPSLRDEVAQAPEFDATAPSPVPPREDYQAADAGLGNVSGNGFDDEFAQYSDQYDGNAGQETNEAQSVPAAPEQTPQQASADTYGEDDLIGAAEGVFGKGAEGLAGLIEDLLRKQGEPNGYIIGREGGGAFIFGVRYGSGTLHHKVEGERKVYWTGPSLGIDAGANAGNTFVLVYNLYDTQDLFKRFPAGEGQAYLVGGMHASYMRRGDIVLIPIRVGAGLRLGVNAGYMRFSEKQRWLPF